MENSIILNSQLTDLTMGSKTTMTELDDSCCSINDSDLSS